MSQQYVEYTAKQIEYMQEEAAELSRALTSALAEMQVHKISNIELRWGPKHQVAFTQVMKLSGMVSDSVKEAIRIKKGLTPSLKEARKKHTEYQRKLREKKQDKPT